MLELYNVYLPDDIERVDIEETIENFALTNKADFLLIEPEEEEN